MAEDKSNKRLGRGLATLIGELDKPVTKTAPETKSATNPVPVPGQVPGDRTVPIESISANPDNPRGVSNEAELEELTSSIAEHGIVQPILVRPFEDGYELIAGERRWRAAQRAGLHDVPVVVRDVDDRQALELAIVENVQRADLNPVEEALGYKLLVDEHGYNQADLGKVIGKSRSHVANTLRLLKLPVSVRALLADGSLSSGHARALITLDEPAVLAKRIVAEGLSVRDVERLVNRADGKTDSDAKPGKNTSRSKDADTLALERRLTDATGLKITITHQPNGKGRLSVDYKNLEQLDDLVDRLEGSGNKGGGSPRVRKI